MKCFFYALSIYVLLLVSCALDPAITGTGTETTNSFAYLPSGRPAANCKVLLIDSRSWVRKANSAGFIVDSTTTGIDGSFSFNYDSSINNSALNIQIDHDSAGFLKRNVSLSDIDEHKFTLKKHSILEGTLEGSTGREHVLAEGTSYRAQVKSDGTFQFTRIPEGVYFMYVNKSDTLYSGGSANTRSGSQTHVELPAYRTNQFLITDFESGYATPSMNSIGIPVYWYLYSDSTTKKYDDTTQQWIIYEDEFPSQGNSSINSSITATDNGSSGMLVNVSLDQYYPGAYAGLGAVLHNANGDGMNFSTINTLKFDIKGQGTVRTGIIAKHPVYNTNIYYSYTFSLTNTSSSISIDLNSIQLQSSTPDSLRVSWKEACSKVHYIEIGFYKPENTTANDVNMLIDNIVLIGSRVESILQF